MTAIGTKFAHKRWRQAEKELVEAINHDREHGATWQAIADALGHGDRIAARRWHQRRTTQ